MNRFNLTFSGEILPGESPDQVKLRFAEMFEIDDPQRLDRFFSGEPIILRRNLERKAAAECFQELRKVGIEAQLVKVTAQEAADAVVTTATTTEKASSTKADKKNPKTPAKKTGSKPAKKRKPRAKNTAKTRKKKRADEVQLDLPLDSSETLNDQKSQRAAKQAADEEKKANEAKQLELETHEKREEEKRVAAEMAAAQAQAQLEAEIATKQREQERQEKEREERRLQKERQNRETLRAEKEEKKKKAQAEAAEQARKTEQIQKSAQPLRIQPTAEATKRSRASVKTSLELPRSQLGHASESQGPIFKKQQPGEPNFYALEAFRNSPNIRNRSEKAKQRARKGLLMAIASALSFIIVMAMYTQQRSEPPVTTLAAVAIDNTMGPTLLASPWLAQHDRAGVSTGETTLAQLGVSALAPPMLYSNSGKLLVSGRLSRQETPAVTQPPIEEKLSYSLLRCDLEAVTCEHVGYPDNSQHIGAFVENLIDGALLVIDKPSSTLRKVTSNGEILASAPIQLPDNPVLVLDAGLLLMNSATAPAISVYRYDTNAFGKKLDEILLLPPAALARKQSQVHDFVRTDDIWWVALKNPESGATNLYRFDTQWNYLGELQTRLKTPATLTAWGEKLLVSQPGTFMIERFNKTGEPETPFSPKGLVEVTQTRSKARALQELAWRSALAVFALLAAAGAGIAWLQRARALVYGQIRERGAPPLDDVADNMLWIPPAKGRDTAITRLAIAYGAIAFAIVAWCLHAAVNAWGLAAILVTLAGPAITLALLRRASPCYVGVANQSNDGSKNSTLALIDHRGVYHMGSGSQIAYRGSCMLLDDVVVHAGSNVLPAFDLGRMRQSIKPLVVGGVRVDRKTLIAKLLEAKHPFAQGALISLACAALGAALWLTGGL
ncbi:MAG: hypothetical protein AB8C02_02535 [Halioglobus sp.]